MLSSASKPFKKTFTFIINPIHFHSSLTIGGTKKTDKLSKLFFSKTLQIQLNFDFFPLLVTKNTLTKISELFSNFLDYARKKNK